MNIAANTFYVPNSLPDTFSVTDLLNLSKELAQLNASYLVVSVTIILATGAAFYFFNLKPLQEKISRQEEELKNEKQSNEEKLKTLTDTLTKTLDDISSQTNSLKEKLSNTIEEKIINAENRIVAVETSANKEITEIKQNARKEELLNLWDKHYLWNIGDLKVHINALSELISYLEKATKYGMHIIPIKMCLDSIGESLDNMESEVTDKKPQKALFHRLVTTLTTVQGHNETIQELQEKAKKILL